MEQYRVEMEHEDWRFVGFVKKEVLFKGGRVGTVVKGVVTISRRSEKGVYVVYKAEHSFEVTEIDIISEFLRIHSEKAKEIVLDVTAKLKVFIEFGKDIEFIIF